MLILNRQQEIVERAKNRLVDAIIYMATPEFLETFPDGGNITPASASGILSLDKTINMMFSPDRHYWQGLDKCKARIEMDPALQGKIVDELQTRNHALTAGGLSCDEQDTIFNSSDLTSRSTGLPARFFMVFNASAGQIQSEIATVPFENLRRDLSHFQEHLQKINGYVQAIEVEHIDALSAFDYNKLITKKYVQGHRFYSQDMLNARARQHLIGISGQKPPRLN